MRGIVPSSGRHGVQIATLSGVALSTSSWSGYRHSQNHLWGMEEAVCVHGYRSNPGRIPVTILPFAPSQIIPKGIRNILICTDTWNILLPLSLTVTQRLLFALRWIRSILIRTNAWTIFSDAFQLPYQLRFSVVRMDAGILPLTPICAASTASLWQIFSLCRAVLFLTSTAASILALQFLCPRCSMAVLVEVSDHLPSFGSTKTSPSP
jgi:hypothetical protein